MQDYIIIAEITRYLDGTYRFSQERIILKADSRDQATMSGWSELIAASIIPAPGVIEVKIGVRELPPGVVVEAVKRLADRDERCQLSKAPEIDSKAPESGGPINDYVGGGWPKP
jgi:hypothetical protein